MLGKCCKILPELHQQLKSTKFYLSCLPRRLDVPIVRAGTIAFIEPLVWVDHRILWSWEMLSHSTVYLKVFFRFVVFSMIAISLFTVWGWARPIQRHVESSRALASTPTIFWWPQELHYPHTSQGPRTGYTTGARYVCGTLTRPISTCCEAPLWNWAGSQVMWSLTSPVELRPAVLFWSAGLVVGGQTLYYIFSEYMFGSFFTVFVRLIWTNRSVLVSCSLTAKKYRVSV